QEDFHKLFLLMLFWTSVSNLINYHIAFTRLIVILARIKADLTAASSPSAAASSPARGDEE
ncbi:MAG TPA: hypothetical protein PKW43_13675, partial [Deltaproteobacteria bacterium]|nr:hypothetical protein [Deltaproteobacteria bacterium]